MGRTRAIPSTILTKGARRVVINWDSETVSFVEPGDHPNACWVRSFAQFKRLPIAHLIALYREKFGYVEASPAAASHPKHRSIA